MMNFGSQVSKRASRAAVVFLLCFGVLMVYIISNKQEMVYYVPDAAFLFINRTKSHTAKAVPGLDRNLESIGPSEISSWFGNNGTSSTTTDAYSLAEMLPKIDMTKLIQEYQIQSKLLTEQNKSLDAVSKVHHSQVQQERIDGITRTCNDRALFRDYHYLRRNRPVYYYSSIYKFSYCKVPKSGSTFWTQAFDVLEHGASVSEQAFGQKRSRVHASMQRYTVNFKSAIRKQSLSILVSRDPFSRLYSAYIDKSYLLLSPETNFSIRKRLPKALHRFCPVDVTFQEFLNFILLNAQNGKTLNRHWAPVYNLCHPCDVNAYILVKQESFSSDVEEALQAFDVGRKKVDVIMSALREHRVEATIPGIVETVYGKVQHGRMHSCVDGKSIAKRLWKSFKVQGYLKKSLKFPSDKFKSNAQYSDRNYVTEVIVHSINKHKMTSSEMKTQRHQALVDAYREINDVTIEGIKELYKIDFEMFGYKTDPPSQ